MNSGPGGPLEPYRAPDLMQARRPSRAQPAVEIREELWLATATALRLRQRTPAHATQTADQAIAVLPRDRLVTQKAGGRKEPPLHSRQRRLEPP